MAETHSYAASGGESRPLSEGGNGNAHGPTMPMSMPMPEEHVHPGATGSVVEPGYAPAEMRSTGRSGGDIFVLVTFVLAMIGWLTALVSQAYVAAKINNELVRIVWFGFVIQTILSVVVFEVIMGSASYNASYAYGTQISILAALAAAFAVVGVDRTIYSPVSSLKATGAGWLIVAIIDVLWILYFTSPPQSPIARLATSMSGPRGGGAHHPKEEYGKVQKIGRSTDAFPMSAINQQHHERVPSGVPTSQHEGRAGVGAGQQQWNYTPGTTNQRTTVTTMPSEGARSTTHTAGGGIAAIGSDGGMSDGRQSGTTAPPETEGAPTMITEAESVVKWRAEALFDYKGSSDDPNELAFKKGDILLVTDKSGKWWEAKKADGRKGIAPSNYLRLLPP
ncbi:hypothetical protein CPB83DRAFT_858765 [Crepidotus variabilis]|uniref:SH3 domain-containing protein n=1 Tax=Crepidotus variabilis TaxID=179855 RepID=A0A9P6EB92_9AGAR|nr:hypothetical protein CPB83DRAFT_858765 [Crepidotus variabilis]